MATELERLFVKFEGRFSDLEKAFAKSNQTASRSAKKMERDFDRSFSSLERRAKASGAKIGRSLAAGLKANAGAVGLGLGGLVSGSVLKDTISDLSAIGKVADTIGLTTDALQQLRFQGELAGVALQTTDRALLAFSKRVGEALLGRGELAKVFDEYGVSIRNVDGSLKGTLPLLREVGGLMETARSSTERAAIASAAFSRAGIQFGALVLARGAASFQAAVAQFEKTGGPISEADIRLAENLDDELLTIERTLGRLGQQGSLLLLKGLTGIVEGLQKAKDITDTTGPLELLSVDGGAKIVNKQLAALRNDLEETTAQIIAVQERLSGGFVINRSGAEADLALLRTEAEEARAEIERFENALLLFNLKDFARQAVEAAAAIGEIEGKIASGALPATAIEEPIAKLNALRDVLKLLEPEARDAGAGFEQAFAATAETIDQAIASALGGFVRQARELAAELAKLDGQVDIDGRGVVTIAGVDEALSRLLAIRTQLAALAADAEASGDDIASAYRSSSRVVEDALISALSGFVAQARQVSTEASEIVRGISLGDLPEVAIDAPIGKLTALSEALAGIEADAVSAGGTIAAEFEKAAAAVTAALEAASQGISATVTVRRPESPVFNPSDDRLDPNEIGPQLDALGDKIVTGFERSIDGVIKPLGEVVDASRATTDATAGVAAGLGEIGDDVADGLDSNFGSLENTLDRGFNRMSNAFSGLGASILRGSAFAGSGDISGIDLDKIRGGFGAIGAAQQAIIDLMRQQAAEAERRLRAEEEARRLAEQIAARRGAIEQQIAFQEDLLKALSLGLDEAFPEASPQQLAGLVGPDADLYRKLVRLQEQTNALLAEGNDATESIRRGLLEPISQREADLISFGRSAAVNFGDLDTRGRGVATGTYTDNRETVIQQNFNGAPEPRDGRYLAERILDDMTDSQARDLRERIGA